MGFRIFRQIDVIALHIHSQSKIRFSENFKYFRLGKDEKRGYKNVNGKMYGRENGTVQHRVDRASCHMGQIVTMAL